MKNRKDFFDIPKKIHINEAQSEWADARCEEKVMAFAAYVRWLIDEDKNRIEEELSQQKQCSNRPNLDPNMGNPNGLSHQEIQAVAVAVAAALGQLNRKS